MGDRKREGDVRKKKAARPQRSDKRRLEEKPSDALSRLYANLASPSDIQILQRTYGNRHVQRVIASKKFIVRRQEAAPEQLPAQQQPQPQAPPVNPVAQQVWNAHASIHAHFNNDVRQFETQTQQQWDNNRRAHVHFHAPQVANYRRIYPSYFDIGINNPAQWIATNIRWPQFLGQRLNVHQDLVPMLTNVQTRVRNASAGGNAGVNRVGGFVPRNITGGTTLSFHGVGRAIDINAGENPLFSLTVNNQETGRSLVIRTVTGLDLRNTTDYTAQSNASQTFQNTFNDAWVQQQRQQLTQRQQAAQANPNDQQAAQAVTQQQRLVNAIDNNRAQLDNFAQNGFLNLQQVVVDEMQAEGFTWGGEWHTKKDYMHFETGALGP